MCVRVCMCVCAHVCVRTHVYIRTFLCKYVIVLPCLCVYMRTGVMHTIVFTDVTVAFSFPLFGFVLCFNTYHSSHIRDPKEDRRSDKSRSRTPRLEPTPTPISRSQSPTKSIKSIHWVLGHNRYHTFDKKVGMSIIL